MTTSIDVWVRVTSKGKVVTLGSRTFYFPALLSVGPERDFWADIVTTGPDERARLHVGVTDMIGPLIQETEDLCVAFQRFAILAPTDEIKVAKACLQRMIEVNRVVATQFGCRDRFNDRYPPPIQNDKPPVGQTFSAVPASEGPPVLPLNPAGAAKFREFL